MENFQYIEIFHDMEGPVLNCVEISVEIQDMKIFLFMEISQDLEVKHHSVFKLGRKEELCPGIARI